MNYMDPWNHNIAEAPHDAPIWGASKCGKVIKCDWIEKRQAWSGFTDKSPPLAWKRYEKPTHPHEAFYPNIVSSADPGRHDATIAELRKALNLVKAGIVRADPAVLTDTLWMPDDLMKGATVVDVIDAALSGTYFPFPDVEMIGAVVCAVDTVHSVSVQTYSYDAVEIIEMLAALGYVLKRVDGATEAAQ